MKRIFTLLLVLAMVGAMLVAPGYATEEKQTQTQVGYCQHCKTMIPEDQWLPWDATNAASWAGHYYLAEDVADQPQQISSGWMPSPRNSSNPPLTRPRTES